MKRSIVILLAVLAFGWLAGSYEASHDGQSPAPAPSVTQQHNGTPPQWFDGPYPDAKGVIAP